MTFNRISYLRLRIVLQAQVQAFRPGWDILAAKASTEVRCTDKISLTSFKNGWNEEPIKVYVDKLPFNHFSDLITTSLF